MQFDWGEYAGSADVPGGSGDSVTAGGEVSCGRGAGGGERDSFCRGCGAAAGGGGWRLSGGRVTDAGGTARGGAAGVDASPEWRVPSTEWTLKRGIPHGAGHREVIEFIADLKDSRFLSGFAGSE